jgi:hypothetical protein
MGGETMFLKKVKVKAFAQGVKLHGVPPWGRSYKSGYRVVKRSENKQPDDVYTVIGKTMLNEGETEYIGVEEGMTFNTLSRKMVYIVAKGLGRRFYVLPEDMQEQI